MYFLSVLLSLSIVLNWKFIKNKQEQINKRKKNQQEKRVRRKQMKQEKAHNKRTTNDLNFLDRNVLHDCNDILDKQVFKCQKGYSRFASEAATGDVL